MKRRKFIKQGAGAGLAIHPLISGIGAMPGDPGVAGLERPGPESGGPGAAGLAPAGPRKPVFVYNNWSAYDELSDKVVQTEALAMRELKEVIRLKKAGVEIDYYVMDAFWFDKEGGYRRWHREHWPDGPGKWLDACRENNIKPGMWFSSNLIATHESRFLEPVQEWKDSLATDSNILCLFEGGYLGHLADTLQLWYDKGVRLFKFDFAYFEAATPAAKARFTPEEILEKNKLALMGMLSRFRARNEGVLITGYNGFGGDMENTFTPFRNTIDHRWLDVFDTLYCGDPRFSDVPMMNIWRSQDNYSDHMVRQFQFNGLPLRRIDNCAFMIGTTGTCYYRGGHAWKGMLWLELARGGWMNVYHGNLELLDEADAKWFARVQRLYRSLQEEDACSTFGGIPGKGLPYGFKAAGKNAGEKTGGKTGEKAGEKTGESGVVYTVVNPSQVITQIPLPACAGPTRILYADGGYVPFVKEGLLTLGAEQLVVVGTGGYADHAYALGSDPSIRIPFTQDRIQAEFMATAAKNTIAGRVQAVPGKDLRIILQQFGANGLPFRSWGGAPPDGKKMDTLIQIRVRQGSQEVPLHIEYDKMIWSGLSWAAAEVKEGSFDPGLPLDIQGWSAEQEALALVAHVYAVGY